MTLYGQLEFTNKEISKIKEIYNKIDKSNEFEVMFYNYKSDGSNVLSMKRYLTILEYMTKRSKIRKLKIERKTTLDVIYGEQKQSFRISIDGIENIHKYMNMISRRKNHIIFKTLLSRLDDDESLSIDKKVKTRENILDVDNYNTRFRLSEELEPTKKELKELEEITQKVMHKIIFRYKQRVSLIVLDETDARIQFDLTNIKMDNNINMVENSIPRFELELEILPKRSKVDDHLEKIMLEIETMHKVIQQCNFIIGQTESTNVLSAYRHLVGASEKDIILKGRNPISLEIQHAVDILPNNYSVTDKADGQRYFLIILENKVYLIDNNLNVKNTGIVLKNGKYNNTLLDGEYIFLPKHNRHLLMIFDCLFDSNEDIRQTQSFMERLEHAKNIVNECFVFEKQSNHTPKQWKGKFDTSKIEEHYSSDIKKYMDSINENIPNNKLYPLVRTKYFIGVDGGKDNEIFKYSYLLWNKYVFDSDINCPYTLDGLIYQPLEQKYITGQSTKYFEYKWKPHDMNSIDFYIKFVQDKKTGKDIILFDNSVNLGENRPYKVCNLHCGMSSKGGEYPVFFQEDQGKYIANIFLENGEARDLEGNIIQDSTVVEFYFNTSPEVDDRYSWVPMRTRFDKTESVIRYKRKYGNPLVIANKIWRSIINPFSIDDIHKLSNDNEFYKHNNFLKSKIDHTIIMTERQENAYYKKQTNLAKPMRQFHQWIKSILIYTYCNNMYERNKTKNKILGIGIGRGGDMFKFYYVAVELYVGTDIDNESLISVGDSALRRYNDLKRAKANVPPMHFVQADGGAIFDYDEQIKVLGSMQPSNKTLMSKYFSKDKSKRTIFDRIDCEMAMHYFLENETIWGNFCENLNMYLKEGGFYTATCFDANEVIKLLKDKEKHTTYYTDKKGENNIFFDLIKKYDDKDLENGVGLGHAIDLHNATINREDEYYTEYLVDKDFVIKEFAERANLELVDTGLFVNQFEIHRDYFENVANFEQNPNTRKFLMRVAGFYNHDDDINRASFEFSKLFRYYAFRKKEKHN